MKLVVDTNTLISGSLWQGLPARLLSAALAGQAQLFLSLPQLLELRETLQHPKFTQRLAGRGETANHWPFISAPPATKQFLPGSRRRPTCATRTMPMSLLVPWR